MWNDRKSKLTVPLSSDSNIATFYLAHGYSKFGEFCMSAEVLDGDPIVGTEKPMDKEELATNKGVWSKDIHAKFLDGPTKRNDDDKLSEYDFDIDHQVNEGRYSTKETDKEQNLTLELLNLHHKFGHISFKKLQHMAKQGVILSKYATCDVPVCATCVYGKMIRKQWQNKSVETYENQSLDAKVAGELVAVDQMVSPTPGFIAQITGRLTTKRYKYATIFVDIATRYGYMCICKSRRILKKRWTARKHSRHT